MKEEKGEKITEGDLKHKNYQQNGQERTMR